MQIYVGLVVVEVAWLVVLKKIARRRKRARPCQSDAYVRSFFERLVPPSSSETYTNEKRVLRNKRAVPLEAAIIERPILLPLLSLASARRQRAEKLVGLGNPS